MQPVQEASFRKVKDLSPTTKQVDLVVRVVSVGQRRTIDSKFGGARTLCEAIVGDETGTVILSLWEAQSNGVADGDALQVNNGYVSLVRGRIRLNVGKYGTLEKSARPVGDVNKANDISLPEHDAPPRDSRGGSGGGFGGARRTYSGRPRGNERRLHGRRRF